MRFLIRSGRLLVALGLVLAGCVKSARVPPGAPSATRPSVPSPPTLEKTFGNVSYGGLATLLIQYKNISIVVDPCFEPKGAPLAGYARSLNGMTPSHEVLRTKDPGLGLEKLPLLDYLLLTDAQPHHFG